MGNGSRCRLSPSRRRTPGRQMACCRLECKVLVPNGPVGCILPWFRMPKWKSWLKGGKPYANVAESIESRGGGNAAVKNGTLGTTIERILADLKPEAAYFFADDSGQRSGSIVFDMKDTSQIPAVAEPWFLAFNANISLRPIMNPQDLAKAGPSIGKAAKQYGK